MIALNVGCHDIPLAGFINIDNDPATSPDLLYDATKLRGKFQDDSVDFIYCGHFFEHFVIEQGYALSKDFYAILKPYGSLACVVPDWTKTIGLAVESSERIILAEGQHKALYNDERLLKVLRTAGFTAWELPIVEIPWCRFPNVVWQTAVLGIKHPPVTFPRG